MKKFYLIIALLFLNGCGSNIINKSKSVYLECPEILFASEHKIYLKRDNNTLSLDDISFQAEINNGIFSNKCLIKDGIFHGNLSILFVVSPLYNPKNPISIPYYVAILDKNRKLIEIQYFLSEGEFKKNYESSNLLETDIITNETIKFKSINQAAILVVGMLIDQKQIDILN